MKSSATSLKAIAISLFFLNFGCEETTKPNQPPTVTIINGPAGTIASNEVTFSWRGDDSDGEVTGFYYDMDDSTPDTWTSSSEKYFTVSSGTHSFYIKAKDDDGAFSDIADRSFTVVNPSMNITSPNGGESWQLGTTHTITWNSSNAGNYVKIDLYQSGSYSATIASSTLNDGSYSWSIPTTYTASSSYKVKITDTGNSEV